MTNLICPACNNNFELKDSMYYYHNISFVCKVRVYYNNMLANNGYCLSLEDELDFYIKYNYKNSNYVGIYWKHGSDLFNYGSLITNCKDAYDILIKYKENVVFL